MKQQNNNNEKARLVYSANVSSKVNNTGIWSEYLTGKTSVFINFQLPRFVTNK